MVNFFKTIFNYALFGVLLLGSFYVCWDFFSTVNFSTGGLGGSATNFFDQLASFSPIGAVGGVLIALIGLVGVWGRVGEDLSLGKAIGYPLKAFLETFLFAVILSFIVYLAQYLGSLEDIDLYQRPLTLGGVVVIHLLLSFNGIKNLARSKGNSKPYRARVSKKESSFVQPNERPSMFSLKTSSKEKKVNHKDKVSW